METFDPSEPLSVSFQAAVAARLREFVTAQRIQYGDLAESVSELFTMALAFTTGGKRFRPAFCYWSYVAATDDHDAPAVLTAAASLDLLHVSALVHDDLMDASDMRRSLPTAHRQFEANHLAGNGVGSPRSFGGSAAILLGDLLLTWSAEMFDRAGLTPESLLRGLPHLHAMRTEVALGQYLDVRSQALPPADPEAQLAAAVQVTEYKTASYSVRRPCLLGSALGGADIGLERALAAFGSPLGRAYQMRDDLLGIFGDPAATGKPAGDDLREGKRTTLIALAMSLASPAQAAQLSSLIGVADLDEAQLDLGREIISGSGALAAAEQRIESEFDQAMAALNTADISDRGRIALTRLAEVGVNRVA